MSPSGKTRFGRIRPRTAAFAPRDGRSVSRVSLKALSCGDNFPRAGPHLREQRPVTHRRA
ncbi:MAG: hypothetical protein LDL37_01980 [Asticcacaulis sp.]|uniref:hypothetical protein n=1 Tax=Asticcacaulis sp. TaxID=1872648 RepID=UPI0025BDB189|nr:hypothetical protein [Asticcacaulis sp.]MCA1934189.1 hypothetical protein [Asticcacaulis sp.]